MRRGARLLGRHAAREVVVDFLREVGVELARALLVPLRRRKKRRRLMRLLLRRGPQDPVDGADDLVPAVGLGLELPAPFGVSR